MAENSGFFNAVESAGVYDRVYDASDFATLFKLFMTNGVFANPSNQLQVVAKSGLTVTIKAGYAFIEGYWYELTEDKDLTLTANSTSTARYSVIVCKLDRSSRKISVAVRDNQTSVGVTRDGNIYELMLAYVNMAVGASSISQSNIVDVRTNEQLCGIVKGSVDQINTNDLFAQYTAAFSEWFNRIKGQLTTDAAGNLQTQITDMKDNFNDSLDSVKKTLQNHMNNLSVKQYYDTTKNYFRYQNSSYAVNLTQTINLNSLVYEGNSVTSGMYFIKIIVGVDGIGTPYEGQSFSFIISIRKNNNEIRSTYAVCTVGKMYLSDRVEKTFMLPLSLSNKNEIVIKGSQYSQGDISSVSPSLKRNVTIEMQKVMAEE